MNATVTTIHDARTDIDQPGTAASTVRQAPRVPVAPVERFILGERLFKDTLVRERRRADRLSMPFAVIVLDRTHLPADEGAWEAVYRAVATSCRDVDVAGWLEQDLVLAVILPEVTQTAASDVVRRLRRATAAPRTGSDPIEVSMRLYTHGVPTAAHGTPHPPVDLLIDTFVPPARRPASDRAKRALDITGSLALLALFSPAMLAAYIAVKLSSPGPVLFRQERVGRRGDPFTMLKFRSMRTDAGHAIHKDYVTWFITSSDKQPRADGEVFKLTADPRITRVGHWLRKTSLDELPQFLNVLRGDMSLVGPRPPLPFEVDKYQPWHRRRVLDAKPGITGMWQVKGRSRTTFDEMVRMDLEYARTRSLWTDIRILAATPRAMVKGAC